MLRKLFGFRPVRLSRPVRTGTRAPAAGAEVAPHRRKPVLEALESRLLLSADPLGALDGYGVLALQLGDGNDQALVERIGESATGGDIVVVTLGSVTQQYGDQFFGIVKLLIDAGAGDDWLRIIGVTVTTDVIGGLGTDTLEWQQGDATWSITDRDSGQVETASFSSFEHLVGGDDNRDTFLFAAGAVVSGSVEGGAGGFDSIVIQGGEYQSVTYTAHGPESGTIAMDGREVAFDGIEPVTLGVTAVSLTLNATIGDDVVRLHDDAASDHALLESVTGTFADLAFLNPTASLTINLGSGDDRITIETLDHGFSAAFDVRGGDGRDRIDFAGTVATHGHDLSAAAEAIVVGPGSVLRTDLGADGAVGDMGLAAAAASTDALGAADASMTVVDATLIGRNITISATATFTVNAEFIDGSSTATVAILGGEVAASDSLAIGVRSFVSATVDAADADVTVTSTAAARIGGAATLEAGTDLAVDVVNAVDVTAAGGPVALATIALETIAFVDGDATLAAQDVSLRAASDASFALAGVVAVAEVESVTSAGMAGGLAIDLGRRTSLAIAESDDRTAAGTLADEALRTDLGRDPARPIDLAGDVAAGADDEGVVVDLYRVAPGRPLPEASELVTDLYHAGPVDRLWGAVAGELAAAGTFGVPAEPQFDETPAADSVIARGALAASAGAIVLLPATDADVDGRGARRPGVESEQDGDDGDTGLGASLALSMIKDSALAELARTVTTGGGAVLSASGVPFARGRARGAPDSDAIGSGGALEIGDADATGTVILAEVGELAGDPGCEGGDAGADDRNALHFAGADELVLATAARHDLVAEATGGAERGTGVTAVTPIDVASADATAELGPADTFTLAALSDAADGHDAAPEVAGLHDGSDGSFAGLVLSTHVPALEFEVLVGPQDAIRSGDDVDALAGARAIAVSGLLDPAVLAPAAAPGRASGHDVGELVRCLDADVTDGAVAASAEVAIGDSRQVVMAYLGALAAPIAASAGLTPHVRRRDAGVPVGGDRRRAVVAGATEYASRAELGGHRDAFRSGGGWVERFVNELGLAPEDQNPNAKIKIKL